MPNVKPVILVIVTLLLITVTYSVLVEQQATTFYGRDDPYNLTINPLTANRQYVQVPNRVDLQNISFLMTGFPLNKSLSDLAVYFTFNNTLTSTDGTYTFLSENNPPYVSGILAEAVSFNGINQSLNITDYSTAENIKTVELVFNITEVKAGNFFFLSAQNDRFNHFVACTRSGAVIECSMRNTPFCSNCWTLTSTTAIADMANKSVHLAITTDGANYNLLINGNVEDSAAYIPNIPANWTALTVGTGVNGYYHGTVDNLRLWNRQLSTTELFNNWQYLVGNITTQTPSNTSSISGFYPQYLNVTYNDAVQFYQAELFNSEVRVSLDPTISDQIMQNGCNCTECVLSGQNCRIPIDFQSTTSGILQFNLTNASYSFGLDDCSTFTENRFNFSTRTIGGTLLDSNISFDFNFYIDPADKHSFVIEEASQIYDFCVYPTWTNITADMIHDVTSGGYESTSFTEEGALLFGNFNIYLEEVGDDVHTVTYILRDITLREIENATMKFYRTIGGVTTLIQTGISDFAGQVVVSQDKTKTYDITINATGYPVKSFSLKPVLTTYTIKISQEAASFAPEAYAGIRYRLTPQDSNYEVNKNHTITFELQGSDFEFWGINLTGGVECVTNPCSNVSTTATGGAVTVVLIANETESFTMELFYKKEGQNIIYINPTIKHIVEFIQIGKNVGSLIGELKGNTSFLFRTIIATGITIVGVGVASMLGVFGGALVIIIGLIQVALSLPPIQIINPLFGILSATFSILVGVFLMVFRQ